MKKVKMLKNVMSYLVMYPLLRDDQKKLNIIYDNFSKNNKFKMQTYLPHFDMIHDKINYYLYSTFPVKRFDINHILKKDDDDGLNELQRSLIYLPI